MHVPSFLYKSYFQMRTLILIIINCEYILE